MKNKKKMFDLDVELGDDDIKELFEPFHPVRPEASTRPVKSAARWHSARGLKSGIMAGASLIGGVIAIGQNLDPAIWITLFILSALFYRFGK